MGVHWPDLDEDLSVAGTLIGGPSGESARSLGGWLLEAARICGERGLRSLVRG